MSSHPDSAPAAVADPLSGWIARLQAGESSALEPLIEHTQNRGWQIAYSILQNRQEVEDALQDAYLLVYQNIGQLQEPKAFWGWFKRLLVNRCLRMRQRRPVEPLQEDQAVQPPPGEAHLDVSRAFASLSLADRTVLGLREILDYSYEEMSQLLELPLSTIKTRLHNARGRLFRFFSKEVRPRD